MKHNLIKDNISKDDFNHLINYLKIDDSIRASRKDRLTKIFYILYLTGIRVNETTQLTNNNLIDLLNYKELKIISHKQKNEKYIYITEQSKKMLSKVFFDLIANDDFIFVSERGNKKQPMRSNAVTLDVNSYLKKVFINKRITSHSFRQSLISDLATKNINTKIIQSLIGHKDIKTTYRYIKPSQIDIINSLDTVR